MNKILTAVVILAAAWFIYAKVTAPKIKNLKNSGEAVVCLGDSLTYGYGAARDESYPARLALKTKREVVNLGVSGDRSVDGLARVDEVFDYNPYMVIIEFGGNDFMKQVPFSRTVEAVSGMVDAVQARGAIAVIADTGGNPFMSKYGEEYKKTAKEKGAVFVPAIMDGVMTKPQLKSDTIHPNAAGYAIVADRVYDRIKKYI